ncbi:MAG: DUF3857 domain-containing protein, partial [Candidatus Marinimicrobia bacterium]|nr:DUF3857 domain-containing protein [Candidatus Neomarinimicrobiota bacterium]
MSTVIKSIYIGILILILGFTIAFSESHVVTETLDFVISDDGTGVLKVKRLVRVEDERGKSLGKVQFQDNKYTDTKNIEARLLDQNMKIVKKLKKKDIEQYKGASSYGTYIDYTFLAFELSSTSLPYYVEYSYVKEYRSLFFWGQWFPESDFLVKESIYRLTAPKNFQYRIQRIGGDIDSTYDPKSNTVTWKLTDIPAFEDEYRMCPEDEDRFGILFVPLKYELDGAGSTETWNDLGSWCRNLYDGVYDLKDESLAEIGLPEFSNAGEIVSTAFRYIQEKTHYVLINPGIHGWKPHSAQSIFDNKYGDCKDLATLLI